MTKRSEPIYTSILEYKKLAARLAASEAEVARAHAAETLADERWMRDGELRDAAEAERDSLRDKLAEAREIVTNFVGIAKDNGINQMKYDSFGVRVNKFLAALQQSEKGL